MHTGKIVTEAAILPRTQRLGQQVRDVTASPAVAMDSDIPAVVFRAFPPRWPAHPCRGDGHVRPRVMSLSLNSSNSPAISQLALPTWTAEQELDKHAAVTMTVGWLLREERSY